MRKERLRLWAHSLRTCAFVLEASPVKVDLLHHLLVNQDSCFSIGCGRGDFHVLFEGNRGWPVEYSFLQYPSIQLSIAGDLKPKNFRERRLNVRIAYRSMIHKLFFEVWSIRSHEVERVAPPEAAVHSLSML